MSEILLVLPVYNEQASIQKVVTEWFAELEKWTEDFLFLAIDDGSTDETHALLLRLQERFGRRLEVVSRPNRGHGQTCLEGYRIACARKIPYAFQVDSDGQCDPQYFSKFWRERSSCDVIYGRRTRRDDGWRRTAVTHLLRVCVFLWARADCVDANVPYRLMRTAAIVPLLDRIPPDFNLANIALAVLLRRTPGIRQGAFPIRFGERYGGEPAVPLSKFFTRALELRRQLAGILDAKNS